jgi:hypothetical protein
LVSVGTCCPTKMLLMTAMMSFIFQPSI